MIPVCNCNKIFIDFFKSRGYEHIYKGYIYIYPQITGKKKYFVTCNERPYNNLIPFEKFIEEVKSYEKRKYNYHLTFNL